MVKGYGEGPIGGIKWGDLVVKGYGEGPIGGIKWGDLVVKGYGEGSNWVTLSLKDMKEVKRRDRMG